MQNQSKLANYLKRLKLYHKYSLTKPLRQNVTYDVSYFDENKETIFIHMEYPVLLQM